MLLKSHADGQSKWSSRHIAGFTRLAKTSEAGADPQLGGWDHIGSGRGPRDAMVGPLHQAAHKGGRGGHTIAHLKDFEAFQHNKGPGHRWQAKGSVLLEVLQGPFGGKFFASTLSFKRLIRERTSPAPPQLPSPGSDPPVQRLRLQQPAVEPQRATQRAFFSMF